MRGTRHTYIEKQTGVKLGGQLDSWTRLAGFPISGIIFANRKGCGGGSPPHINIYKIQSFPPILK